MSLSVQFLSLLAMIGTGVVAGAFMDMIGTATAQAGKKTFIRRHAAWFEVIGWIVVGCWTFYILFLVRDGAWRMYDPVAQISGLLLYASFFYKPFRLLGRIVLLVVIKPLWFIVRLVITIIRQILRIIVKFVVFLFMPFVKLYRIISRRLTNLIQPKSSASKSGKKNTKKVRNSGGGSNPS
ncbi:spore cortex biosynthesis protein YabQ [Sporosarcina sp. YIM B06819]|uniref:spore cortex biosynthesis protein YabQ n=1 Tax=Sporosarcina sp. YIM B06819 TaxID=3081769 RepID=UPI00298CAD39|nr:spore cortex biosynthesis protein YabQ [Sporosarcina sp. YIM B06819]